MGNRRSREDKGKGHTVGAQWGSRWLRQLESSSEAYSSRFRSSRAIAKPANVLAAEVEPGHAKGRIVDNRGEIHQVDIAVRELSEGEREDVVAAIAARADTLAALLDGEIPPNLIDAVSSLEVDIFPAPSELRPDCACAEWAEPCLHAGALVIVLGRLFDQDPFDLLTLRGLPRSELLAQVRAKRTALTAGHPDRNDATGAYDETVERIRADPWKGWDSRRELAAPPTRADGLAELDEPHETAWVPFTGSSGHTHPAPAPGSRKGAAGSSDDVPNLGFDLEEPLSDLRHDAMIRSSDIISLGRDSMLSVGFQADLARLAAEAGWRTDGSDVARSAGISRPELDALAEAWRAGGAEGVDALTDSTTWSTDQDALSDARDQLVSLGFEKREVSLNYNSLGIGRSRLLVRSTSGQWYLLTEGGHRSARRLAAGPLERPGDLGSPDKLPPT